MDRRQFVGVAAAGGAAAAARPFGARPQPAATASMPAPDAPGPATSAQFDIAPGIAQPSSFYPASHARPVRGAIERHRLGLDREAHRYIDTNVGPLARAVREEAARYLGV